jgi:beta-lactamase regulating signal transducer with metallopeptidase domain
MSGFLARFYPGDTTAIAAVAAFVQITVVIALAAAAGRLLKRRAALRHAVWLCALGCVFVSPFLAVMASRMGMGWLRIESPQSRAIVEEQPIAPDVEPLAAPPTTAVVSSPESPQLRETVNPLSPAAAPIAPIQISHISKIPDGSAPVDPWRAVGGALFLAWIVGAAFLGLRLLHGIYGLARLQRKAVPLNSPRMAAVLDSACRGLGVQKLSPIRTSPLAPGPAAVGVFFPCVLLPEGMLDALDDGQLRDVLIHECAHLLRRDPLVGLLQRLAEAIFWPHPLLPYLNRRLARAREEVCDDYVLRVGDAPAYARTLLMLSENGGRALLAAPGLIDPNWKLEDRVAGLLDPRRTPMKPVHPLTFACLAMGLLAVCTAGAVVCAGGETAKKDNADTNKPKYAVVASDVSNAVIEGIAVDEAGKPVGGAVVRVVSYTPSPGLTPARTAADGTFRLILNQASARYTVIIASAEDGARQGIYEFHDSALPQTVQARIVVKPSRKMTVRVTDGAKKPVEGAAVGALEYSTLLANAETDAQGTVSLRLPRDARVYQVVALKPQVGLDYFENYRFLPMDHFDEPPAQVDLVLNGARTISVRAVDSADKPLAGIKLNPVLLKKKGKLYPLNLGGAELKYVSARTDHDGLAAFEWIPADEQDIVTILCDDKEYCLPNPLNQNPTPPYETLTAKLLRKTPISGKATLPDGKPAAGVLLQVECFRFRSVVRTKADGSYSLLVYPNQTYNIAVTDENWAARSYSGVVVGQETPPVRFDFRLSKGTILRGKMTGPDDKPAPKQTLTVIEQGPGETLIRWAETGPDGRYAIRLGPGAYLIRGPLQRDKWEGINVTEEQTIDKDFHLARLTELERLKGVVLAETVDGKPVAGAILRAMAVRSNGSGMYKGAADETGRFELRRPPVKTLLYARNPEGTLAAIATIGEDEETVKVVLSSAGKILGRVLDKSGKPEKGVPILYGPRLGPQDKPFNTYVNTQTDDAGRFTLLGVVPGSECSISVLDGKSDRRIKVIPATKAEALDLGDLVPGAKR